VPALNPPVTRPSPTLQWPLGQAGGPRVYGEVVINVCQERQGFISATVEVNGDLDFEDRKLDRMADEALTAFEQWRERNSRPA
jgi:hypothetical protein